MFSRKVVLSLGFAFTCACPAVVAAERGVGVDRTAVRAAGRGAPWIGLRDGNELPVIHANGGGFKALHRSGRAKPVSLTSADFDEDGVADLISGYAMDDAGALVFQQGCLDSIFPNHASSLCSGPFLLSANVLYTPAPPEWLEAGDFDADGHPDIVLSATGADELWFLGGDGHGDFLPAERIGLPGRVTALTSGEINRRDGLQDIVAAVAAGGGSEVWVFESPRGALHDPPEIIPLPQEVTGLALGQLDGEYPIDLAVAAGRQILIIHGRDRELSVREPTQLPVPSPRIDRLSFSFEILAVVAGEFALKDGKARGMALLSRDGAVRLLPVDSLETSLGDGRSARRSSKPVFKLEARDHENGAAGARLGLARISGQSGDDLLLMDPPGSRLQILYHRPGSSKMRRATLDVAGTAVAVLPMRLNEDALDDLVVLSDDASSPAAALTAPQNTFVVNSNSESFDVNPGNGVCLDGAGFCTLRAAIQEANALGGADTITFNIGTGTPSISSSALPTITDPLSILGDTGGATRIELNGESAGSAFGMTLGPGSDGSTLRALVINRFGGGGIQIQSGGNRVENCYVGPDASGGGGVSKNGGPGISLTSAAASGNIIGGTTSASRNVISNNTAQGIIDGSSSSGTTITSNFIGTNAAGLAALPNASGVILTGLNCTIGGSTSTPGTPPGNVVSGNTSTGISIGGGGTIVQGCLVGTQSGGTSALGNGGTGTTVTAGTVGGSAVGFRNIISGNLQGAGVSGSGLLQGNFIGLDASGTVALPNNGVGVSSSGAIGGLSSTPGQPPGNVISGNKGNGVALSSSGSLQGNLIGTNGAGTVAIKNFGHGVSVTGSGVTIGGSTATSRNVISGNTGATSDGVSLSGTATVSGNFIGTDISGTYGLNNGRHGVNVTGSGSLIGGTTSTPGTAPGNVISGNGGNGVFMTAPAANNTFAGNLIGTNAAGTSSVKNASNGIEITGGAGNTGGNTIGGTTVGSRNVISGNDLNGQADGVHISGLTTRNNTIAGNFIGTDITGTLPLSNGANGVLIESAQNNTIGGLTSTPGTPPGNVISGNNFLSSSDGLEINGSDGVGNKILGNIIGLNASGTAALANRNNGVLVTGVTNAAPATGNTIGGTTSGSRNVISGNNLSASSEGIEIGASPYTIVKGNLIGTDIVGSAPIGNGGDGVFVTDSAHPSILLRVLPSEGPQHWKATLYRPTPAMVCT